jgi:hypothetical protein
MFECQVILTGMQFRVNDEVVIVGGTGTTKAIP